MANPLQPHSKKRRKGSDSKDEQQENEGMEADQGLIPGLPDHIAHLCLSHVHPSTLHPVCSSWRRLIYSPSFPPFLSLYTLLASSHDHSLHFSSYDPISSSWDPLPPPPPHRPLLLRHPSFISRHLPVQSLSLSHPPRLILLAATTHNFSPALPRPLLFSPLSRAWAFAPQLHTPRRWCAAGSIRGAVYVASGIGSHFSSDVARSAERWDLRGWGKISGLRDGRFSRDAIEAVGWRGKLCVVNTVREGAVYDVEKDAWEEMPPGMAAGWKGPVATMAEEVMYGVDEAKGAVRKYDPERDQWDEVMASDERLIGAQRMAAAAGRLCVVCGGGIAVLVLDVVALPVRRLWTLPMPPAFEAMAVHILPRMTGPGS